MNMAASVRVPTWTAHTFLAHGFFQVTRADSLINSHLRQSIVYLPVVISAVHGLVISDGRCHFSFKTLLTSIKSNPRKGIEQCRASIRSHFRVGDPIMMPAYAGYGLRTCWASTGQIVRHQCWWVEYPCDLSWCTLGKGWKRLFRRAGTMNCLPVS